MIRKVKITVIWFKTLILVLVMVALLAGCASTAMDAHKKGMETITEKEYFIPHKPVDRHFIGCAWSRQFGPVQESSTPDIRIKVERSFNSMQQNFAYNTGVSLGGQLIPATSVNVTTDQSTAMNLNVTSVKAEAGVEKRRAVKTELEQVQIISPLSLADVPFEPNVPYITEALRLGNFRLKAETSGKVGIGAEMSTIKGEIKGETKGDAGTSGQGLVVAYKLHMIDPKTYTKQDSGGIPLELNKTVDFPAGNLLVKARLQSIEAGAHKSLPRNLLWACDQAEAGSRDVIAAWIIELFPRDPRRKSLAIAFPAFPQMGDCHSFSSVIYSRIDPLTDKIIRQKININLIQNELTDTLQPAKWEARMSLVDESFNIRLVRQDDLE